MFRSAVDYLTDAHGPSPRADALRNLDRLVAAAREAIDQVGLQVSAHEIARRAGVGIGTLYRRVPSREALLEAVSREVIDDIIAAADQALTDPDPWSGFTAFAEHFVHLRATSCGINEALGGADTLDLDDQLATIRDRIHALVQRTQASGAMRHDIDWTDLPFLLAGVITVPQSIGLAANPNQWRTNLAILLDGLRTTPTRKPPRRARRPAQ